MPRFLFLFVVVITLASYGLFHAIAKHKENEKEFDFKTREKLKLSLVVNCFFVFTALIFIPFDIFFANSSDFAFSFSDFWWIMVSFGLLIFVFFMVVSIVLPKKAFAFIESFVFSLAFLFYVQRMFLNFFIGSIVGIKLDTAEHPLWAFANSLIWVGVVVGVFALLYKKDLWVNVLYAVSVGLIFVQGIALVSLFITEKPFDLKQSSESLTVTTEGLYELATENNIIVFVLDYYDFSYYDAVKESEPDFYNRLEGFTYFDNTASVYSRSFPSNPYLLTGLELDEYFVNPPDECINSAFEKSSFLSELKNLGFEIDIYTFDAFIGETGKSLARNYSKEGSIISYWGTLAGMLQCSMYFEMPYLVKPFFWIYEINSMAVKENQYILDDFKFYVELLENGLTLSDNKSAYKYIHMLGAHSPYTINEFGEQVPDGVEGVQQWKGCINIVCEYLNQMKALGKYDSATIIITADHGKVVADSLQSAIGPIMFVKPAYATINDLNISHAPVSHSNIFPTVIEAAGGNYDVYGRPFFSIAEDEKISRIFHCTSFTNGGESNILDYEIPECIRDFERWKIKSTKKVLDSMYPVYKG